MLTGFGTYYDKIPDEQLSSAIKERFRLDGRINADQIVIEVKSGHVMLSGVVDTVTEKSLAEGLVAGSIIRVKSVVNNISVRPAVSQDDAIKQQ
ncbi:MAG TPA: BON domain-containing protein [Nitrospirales bacterium]|nr:BON domain-containing protein [Nitrospirales bacterium]